MELKIEKGIPYPGTLWDKQDLYKTIEKMEVGDSMFFKTVKEKIRAYNAASRWALKHRLQNKFKCKKVEGGYRLWRLK